MALIRGRKGEESRPVALISSFVRLVWVVYISMRVESGLIRTISSMVLHVLCIILGLKGAKFLYIVQVEFWVEPHSKAQGYIPSMESISFLMISFHMRLYVEFTTFLKV